jgi:elongation factor Ts
MSTTVAGIDDIKWLRDETGAGIMEAKKALQEAEGNREKAKRLLVQKGAANIAKRAGREAVQGLVEPYIHSGGQIGVIVELDSETDFVARMPEFKELAHEVAMQVAATNPTYLSMEDIPEAEARDLTETFRQEAAKEGKPEKILDKIAEGKFRKWSEGHVLLEQPYIRDDSKKIRDLVHDLAARTRENIVLRRFSRFEVGL